MIFSFDSSSTKYVSGDVLSKTIRQALAGTVVFSIVVNGMRG